LFEITQNFFANNIHQLFQANTSLEEISPWLVTDSITLKKKESKIPIMKTVITTEL